MYWLQVTMLLLQRPLPVHAEKVSSRHEWIFPHGDSILFIQFLFSLLKFSATSSITDLVEIRFPFFFRGLRRGDPLKDVVRFCWANRAAA